LHIDINNDTIEEQNVSVNKKEGGQKDDLGGQKKF
jgi:hypothetical protein